MKKEQRAVYVELAAIEFRSLLIERDEQGNPPESLSLCGVCRHAEWSGMCNELYPVCQHPLAFRDYRLEEAWAWEPGVDCWGFRPAFSVSDIAEYVGQRLQGLRVALPEAVR